MTFNRFPHINLYYFSLHFIPNLSMNKVYIKSLYVFFLEMSSEKKNNI